MPSFDVVSEIDMHEAQNAVDQANREVTTRFDFKGTGSEFKLEKEQITLLTESNFQLKQMTEVLHNKLVKRGIDISCLDAGKAEAIGKSARQVISLQQGIEQAIAKKIVKKIKDQKLKVQAAVNGDKLRITGKKRDDLQQVMAFLKKEDFGLPLQFNNFRD